MALDVIAFIDEQFDRASTPRPTGKPTFLFLKKGYKARIRPLVNLDHAVVMKMHNKFANDAEHRINAVCASEIGQTCKYCELAPADKQLNAKTVLLLPVYVYQIVDAQGNIVTGKNEQGDDEPVKGIRILELSAYGTINAVLGIFRAYYKEEESHDIRVCDFVIEQQGEGQGKQFNTIPKAPSQFAVKLAQVTEARVRERVIEARPPVVQQSVASATANSSLSTQASIEVDDGPDF